MVAICSVDLGDVQDCVVNMKQRGQRFPIVQAYSDDFEHFKFKKGVINQITKKKLSTSKYKVNISSNTLYTNKCTLDFDDCVPCYILDINSTGLLLCECCF